MAQFNLTYDLNVTLEQRLGFEMAALIWSQYLTDDTRINLHISAVDGLDNNEAVGGAVPIFHEVHYGIYQEYLALDASSEEDVSVLRALQDGNTVDFLLDDELEDGNTNIMLTRAQAKALGMDEALALQNGGTWNHDMLPDPDALDGYVVINNSFDWNYDLTRKAEAPENTLDFLTMALHELGHSLGFVSGLDGLIETFELHSGETRTEGFTPLDLLRYSDASVEIENPDGAVSDLSLGAAAYFSLDGGATELAEFEEGDKYQASHWQRFQTAIGIMDPTLGYQERTNISQLDLQAFDALGWDVNYAVLHDGLNRNALYDKALQAISQDFGVGVAAVETAVENGQDWYTLGYGSWWQAFKDQVIEMGYGGWWQEFEAEMLKIGYGSWWQAFDQDLLEMGYGGWWQAFEAQVLEMGYGSWWQTFEPQMLEIGYGGWWQKFEPQMLEMSYGGWWQVFEQQMLAMGYGGWWQEFEANLLELGYGSWWQAFESQVLEMGYGSWWQIFEEKILEMGYGSWWQQFEGALLEMGYGAWWQAFELGYGSWWQEIEQQLSRLTEIEAATITTTETTADGTTTVTTTVTGSIGDDILAGNAGRDLISGDAGYDLIDGKGGDDVLLGDAGDDLIYGWDGDDELHGGAGDDLLSGENDDDRIYGEEGRDILSGGRGHDILEGGDGRDVLKGDTGNDVLDGGAGEDDLAGGGGEDILIGGEGEDVLAGGEGDDHLYGDSYSPQESSANTSSEALLSSLGVSTASQLLDFWVRLEAEDMKLIRYNDDDQAEASAGQVISTNQKGRAITRFSGPTGTYNLIVGYFDDNDAASNVTLQIRDHGEIEEYSWLLDRGAGNGSSSNNFFTHTIEGVSLESGDLLNLIGESVGNEQVRIDYIDVIAVNPENRVASDDSDRLLDAAFYNGNFYAVASDSAKASTEAANRGGSVITVEAGSSLETWLQNILGATANIVEIQGELEAANLISSNKSNESNFQRIEAESLTFTSGYRIEDEDDYDISASENKLLTATNTGTPSSAQFTIEATGIYNLYANYFDSDNGVAEATVLLNGTTLNSWQFNLDDDQVHSRILGLDVVLEAGDILELRTLADGDDSAAIDYFTLEKFSEQDSASLTAETSLRFEAEDMDLSSSAHYNQLYEPAASGDYVVYTSNTNDGLTATAAFTGATGLYDIVVGYFDDNNSSANYSAALAGNLLDSWQSVLELEDSVTGSKNAVARTVARGVPVHTGDSITLQSIREGDDYAFLDYVEFIAHDPTAPIRVEAEYMTLSGDAYLYEDGDASTGRVIRSASTNPNNTVEGVTTFTGATGIYDVVLGYFDENDGEAQFSLNHGETQLDSWISDQNLNSAYVAASNFTTHTVSGVALQTGDEISFTSLRESNDLGTVDYVEFRPFEPNTSSTFNTSSPANPSSTPNPKPTVQLEVEAMDLSGGADIDPLASASGAQYVQVANNYWQFQATSLFSGESGYYDVVVGYYDENDGVAELIVNINNQERDRWFADQNLGASIPNANSFTTRTVASGLYINQVVIFCKG